MTRITPETLQKILTDSQLKLSDTKDLLKKTKDTMLLARRMNQFEGQESRIAKLNQAVANNLNSLHQQLHDQRLTIAQKYDRIRNENPNDPALESLKQMSLTLRHLSSEVDMLSDRFAGQLMKMAPKTPMYKLDEKQADKRSARINALLLASAPKAPTNQPGAEKKEIDDPRIAEVLKKYNETGSWFLATKGLHWQEMIQVTTKLKMLLKQASGGTSEIDAKKMADSIKKAEAKSWFLLTKGLSWEEKAKVIEELNKSPQPEEHAKKPQRK